MSNNLIAKTKRLKNARELGDFDQMEQLQKLIEKNENELNKTKSAQLKATATSSFANSRNRDINIKADIQVTPHTRPHTHPHPFTPFWGYFMEK